MALTASRRFLGHSSYNYSAGAKIEINHNFTNRIAAGLNLRYLFNRYDDYGEYLDGYTHGAALRLIYMFNASMYAIFRVGLEKEHNPGRNLSKFTQDFRDWPGRGTSGRLPHIRRTVGYVCGL
jgi:hypothetical protein